MSSRSSRNWPQKLKWVLVSTVVVLVWGSTGLLWLNKERSGEGRMPCPSNLRQIGLAMMIYADHHQGHYPDSFTELLMNEDLTPDVFVCPSSGASLSNAPTTREAAAQLSKPGRCSYIYAAKGLTMDTPSTIVLAYEPLENHQGDGMNVLFGDGHVSFFTALEAPKMFADLQAGHNPPGPPGP
jgi:prepilin-type processing-associated H-X9-DG protein